MNWTSLLSLFAKPLGAAINNAISAGAGAAVLWATSKGVDGGVATGVVASLALAVSTAISGLASTQGIQIPIINSSDNGVQVVKSGTGGTVVNSPLK